VWSGLLACWLLQVVHGKPAPDVFVAAVQQLGVDPTQCLCFEDAPSGVVVRSDAVGSPLWSRSEHSLNGSYHSKMHKPFTDSLYEAQWHPMTQPCQALLIPLQRSVLI